jgi:hypothetical protein
VLFMADVGPTSLSSKDLEQDQLTALTGRQISTRAMPRAGYWAAHYINRDGCWSVACDALGRIIRCETEKLALSVARYRRRRLQPWQEGNPNLTRTENSVGQGPCRSRPSESYAGRLTQRSFRLKAHRQRIAWSMRT